MSVASYLDSTASSLIPASSEQDSISRSIATLQSRLSSYFGDQVVAQIQFGSSTRLTMLPRSADEHSDVDYMVVFKNADNLKPQTFMDRLRRFAEAKYSTSEIYQSSPTIVLNLNHIKFELVPAYHAWGSTYYIPAPAKSFTEWLTTDPAAFNSTLDTANGQYGYKIKPLIRLLKYWNAQSGYVYSSYEFEQWVAGRMFGGLSSLRDYLFATVPNLQEPWAMAQWKLDKIRRAKEIVRQTQWYESQAMPNTAETEIKKLVPAR
jgi:hypothetical protein